MRNICFKEVTVSIMIYVSGDSRQHIYNLNTLRSHTMHCLSLSTICQVQLNQGYVNGFTHEVRINCCVALHSKMCFLLAPIVRCLSFTMQTDVLYEQSLTLGGCFVFAFLNLICWKCKVSVCSLKIWLLGRTISFICDIRTSLEVKSCSNIRLTQTLRMDFTVEEETSCVQQLNWL